MSATQVISDHSPAKLRVALFASFYRGLFVLNELLNGPYKSLIQVVGLATDDPSQSFVSPAKRVWSNAHSPYEETMVAELARGQGIAVFTGRVKTDTFYKLIEQDWRPDICIMATFGQKIDKRLYNYPQLGFYNLHPCAENDWPTRFPGPNPYGDMIRAKVPRLQIALHRVGDEIDRGELVGLSDVVPIPAQTTVTDLHKLSAAAAASLVRRELIRILNIKT